MESPEQGWIESTLRDRFADKSNVIIAEAIAAIWEEINASLLPVIGQRGVAALFQRSLVITARTYSWLPSPDLSLSALDVTPLRTALESQTASTAITVGGSVLQNFLDLLVGLIGLPLSQRLLRSVSTNLFDGPHAQDTSPCPPK